jgi:hypothetical protein
MVSRGWMGTLQLLLPMVKQIVGKAQLQTTLNKPVGRHSVGTVDMALRSNMKMLPLLQAFGGREQTEAPRDWAGQRRREPADDDGSYLLWTMPSSGASASSSWQQR